MTIPKRTRFVKVTAMLFMKVQMNSTTLNQKWPMIITTPVTYGHQAIPSTPNMIHYELMLTSPSYSFVMNTNGNTDPTNTRAEIDVDFTGSRVNHYIKHLKVVNEFKAQRIFLSKYLDYKARPNIYQNKKDSVMFIYTALNKCRSVDGLYLRSAKWQANTCGLWKVNNHKAKIIGLPAVKDDETTLKGTGGVVIKSLLLTEMIKKKKSITKGDTLFEGSPDLAFKLLVLFGDGLSCDRF